MRTVLQVLVWGVRVDGSHEPALDSEHLVEHHRHRRQTVRRTRGVGDDGLRAVVVAVVDAHHDGEVCTLRRRGHHHLLRPAVQVTAGLLRGGIPTGRLDYDIHAEISPRHRRRPVGDGPCLDPLVSHHEVLAVDRHVVR